MINSKIKLQPGEGRDCGREKTKTDEKIGGNKFDQQQGLLVEKESVACPPQWLPWLPVLLGIHGTASSPKTMGRVLVFAMLSTASGWEIPSHGEALDSPLSLHESTLTGGVDVAHDRGRLALSSEAAFEQAFDGEFTHLPPPHSAPTWLAEQLATLQELGHSIGTGLGL